MSAAYQSALPVDAVRPGGKAQKRLRIIPQPLESLKDEQLVALTVSGDPSAFGELVVRHRLNCYRLALSVLRNEHDAEDEVQDGLLKAFANLRRFDGRASFGVWLSRIVLNECLMRIRGQRRSKADAFAEGFEPAERGRQSPESAFASTEVAALVLTEIRRIPPKLRSAFVLRELEGMTFEDVARRMDLSVPATKSRVQRARVELRSRMVRHHGRRGAATLYPELS